MITAAIEFLQNKTTAALSNPPIKLNEQLQNIGILTPQDLILLDNARTLKIHLYPDNYRGEQLIKLVDRKSDSLGSINKLCYMINCMESRDADKFFKNLKEGKYYTVQEALHDVMKIRDHRKNKRKEESR